MKLEKAKFTIGELEQKFVGYHDPTKRWNGYAMPKFDISTSKKIAEAINSALPDCYQINRNAEDTGFLLFECECQVYTELFDEKIDFEGRTIKALDFLSGTWAWELVEN
jgi:hypothetical protein